MSDEGDEDVDAARDGGDTEDSRRSGGRTALVTKPTVRPQRPSGKRSRQRAADAEGDEVLDVKEPAATAEVSEKDAAKKGAKAKAARKAKAAKGGKPGTRAVNPIAFVYNYLKQVVAEMRKVIWPNRKQMLTYTSVVLVFLAFMVALVGGADLGLSKLVLLVFG
ncbi:Protein translocase subunit SecE [Mycobacterium simulans]|uniref:Protein translocase subunit SecE n=1 Tax=Mycobacterium simulans TaxID=627089 RepID=A0A7Z7IJ87_9MYCO|nr:preprotein translocase subunit SecE [Mycobacterium simulans]SOJ53375.1 Protein translocase subunit SecE [Mycobacterium simulans]SON58905.1 Protein translocase subunit SecE [Mycobacterium simulans]